MILEKKSLVNPEQAAHILNAGHILAYPTETVWGLGASIQFPKSIDRIFQIKNRNLTHSVSLLVKDLYMAHECAEISREVESLLHLFWPGPITFVLPTKKTVPSIILGNSNFIGLRRSAHPFIRKLFNDLDQPITTTSANLSGEPASTDSSELDWLPPDVYLADWSKVSTHKQSSTVIKITDKTISVIREGAYPLSVLSRLIEPFEFNLEPISKIPLS